MKRFFVSILLVAVVVLGGCARPQEENESAGMIEYLAGYGYEVESYKGKKLIESEDPLYKDIVAVQYEKPDAESFIIYTFKVEKDNLVEASLIMIGNKIVGGYAVSKDGDIYSLDGVMGIA